MNAYLPLLVVAVTARYTDWIELNEPWGVMTNGWVIAALAVLLLVEMTVDKIPAVDSLNDILQTVGRPLAGAILFAASSGVLGEVQPVLAFIAGLILAGGVHAAKSVTRPAVTAVTGGMGNWFVSLMEDILALITALLSILLPVIMAALIVMAIILFAWRRSGRRSSPRHA